MGVVLVSRRGEGEGKMGERRIYLASMDHFFQKTGKKSDLSLALGFSLLLSRISNHPPRGGREEIGVEGIGGRGKRIEVEGEEIKVEIGIGGRGEEIEVARIGGGGGEEIGVKEIGERGKRIEVGIRIEGKGGGGGEEIEVARIERGGGGVEEIEVTEIGRGGGEIGIEGIGRVEKIEVEEVGIEERGEEIEVAGIGGIGGIGGREKRIEGVGVERRGEEIEVIEVIEIEIEA